MIKLPQRRNKGLMEGMSRLSDALSRSSTPGRTAAAEDDTMSLAEHSHERNGSGRPRRKCVPLCPCATPCALTLCALAPACHTCHPVAFPPASDLCA